MENQVVYQQVLVVVVVWQVIYFVNCEMWRILWIIEWIDIEHMYRCLCSRNILIDSINNLHTMFIRNIFSSLSSINLCELWCGILFIIRLINMHSLCKRNIFIKYFINNMCWLWSRLNKIWIIIEMKDIMDHQQHCQQVLVQEFVQQENIQKVEQQCVQVVEQVIDVKIIMKNINEGYYGSSSGLTVSTCTGSCSTGYYSTAGSTTCTASATCVAGTYISGTSCAYCSAGEIEINLKLKRILWNRKWIDIKYLFRILWSGILLIKWRNNLYNLCSWHIYKCNSIINLYRLWSRFNFDILIV